MEKLGVKKVKEQTKVKNNRKTRKKSKLKQLLKFLLFLILIILLGYVCYFGYQYYQHTSTMEGKEYDPLSATALGIDPEKLKTIGRMNILLLGESSVGDGYYLTDTIMIASYNPQTQQASLLSIPRDTYVGKKNKDTATQNYLASYKMNAVYRNGENLDETLECVNQLTGLNIEHYILVNTDAIIQIIDAIGGVWFNVPIDMNYDDTNQDLHIHLKAGEQLIDGAKAEQLLRFRHNQDWTTYPVEYGDNDIGRMRTQREFIQATAKQLLKIENVTKVLNLLEIVKNNVRSNLNFDTLKYYIPYAFKFNTSNIVSDTLPGESEQCNGIYIYIANKTKTKQLVQDLFTDKMVVEENETSNTNSVEGQNSEEEAITIELLNGTNNSEILEQVKEKLKQQGYSISKSGTTTSTAKTTIINRTNQANSIAKKIQSTIGVGTLTTGSNNANVDFTIIIGKDYE